MQRKGVYLPDDILARVRSYRFENRMDSEAEAIRCLLEIALTARGHHPTTKTREEQS